MKRWLLVATLVLTGCNATWDPVSPSTDNEYLILAETARLAGLMGVKVTGEITDTPYFVGQQAAVGWYLAGTAYYYRPYVANLGEDGWETVTNVAAHEVCHAISMQHDVKHWECMDLWATPTYPHP